LEIASHNGYFADDGFLGLAPSLKDKNVTSFVKNLKNQGVIDRELFALYLALETNSTVTFGGYPKENIKQGEELVYTSLS
jgi:Eukaryotic aspartyl protease